jgi:hypothetical protein
VPNESRINDSVEFIKFETLSDSCSQDLMVAIKEEKEENTYQPPKAVLIVGSNNEIDLINRKIDSFISPQTVVHTFPLPRELTTEEKKAVSTKIETEFKVFIDIIDERRVSKINYNGPKEKQVTKWF